ncbi:hypothetical protein [uncultured Algoriphagus sp.]|uniref:hypothetical protein n=1 Tax=uncultured Algoriphagus sp. TaxID=417365 RepID=UPI0030ED6102
MSKQEEFILHSMEVYSIQSENNESISLLDIAIDFEGFLLENNYLKSTSKENYKGFYDKYLLGGTKLNMAKLYKDNNAYFSLSYPSNQARSWFIYNEAVNKFNNDLSDTPFLIDVVKLLDDFKYRDFMGKDLYNKYIDCIPDKDFSEKDIYRVPILIHLFGELEFKN